jgi:hypothetical protein
MPTTNFAAASDPLASADTAATRSFFPHMDRFARQK